jgi:hypothetical protein
MQYTWIVLCVCVCEEGGNVKGPRMKCSHASKDSFVKKFIFQSIYAIKIILIFSVGRHLLIVYISHCHPHRSFFTLIQAIRLETARPRKAVNARIYVCPKTRVWVIHSLFIFTHPNLLSMIYSAKYINSVCLLLLS